MSDRPKRSMLTLSTQDCAQGAFTPYTPYRLFRGRPCIATQLQFFAANAVLGRCSRKWMSGHAAYVLVLLRVIEDS